MSTRLSRWTLLIGLAFAVPTLGPTIAEAQADVPDVANLYPGRYAAVCTPGPIFGCVCVIDSSGEALMFTELDSKADHHLKDVADEFLPISIPITAIPELSLCGMACSSSLAPLASFPCWRGRSTAGPSH